MIHLMMLRMVHALTIMQQIRIRVMYSMTDLMLIMVSSIALSLFILMPIRMRIMVSMMHMLTRILIPMMSLRLPIYDITDDYDCTGYYYYDAIYDAHVEHYAASDDASLND